MDESSIHLIKIPLRAERLARHSRHRRLPMWADDGYLAHMILRELLREHAPMPFELRTRHRVVEAWGYSRSDANRLREHARSFGDPSLVETVSDLGDIASKPMPTLPTDRRVGFRLRACPVVRLSKGKNGHRAGAEIDAFLARCFEYGPDTVVDRQETYCRWLASYLTPQRSGARLEGARVLGFARERLFRRTQGPERTGHRMERPDVRFSGELVIEDGKRFIEFLAHGVGRHRSFGFGALFLMPPGS